MKNNLSIGDTKTAVLNAWREDELPNADNFFTGKIEQIIEKAANIFYVKFENLDRLIPADRIS